jgi:PPE-repeat protein
MRPAAARSNRPGGVRSWVTGRIVPASARRRRVGYRIGAGLLAAIVLAVLAGGLARVLMRLLVVLSGEEGRFSVAGTLGILAVFAAMMVPGAVAAALGAHRTSRVLLVLGAAVLLLESVVIPLQEDRTAFAAAGGLLQTLTVSSLRRSPW